MRQCDMTYLVRRAHHIWESGSTSQPVTVTSAQSKVLSELIYKKFSRLTSGKNLLTGRRMPSRRLVWALLGYIPGYKLPRQGTK